MEAKELYRWANWRLVKATTGRYVLEFNVHDALGADCWKEADDLSSDALRALAVWIDSGGNLPFTGILRGVKAPVVVEAEHDRALQEKAWLQGYMAGCDDTHDMMGSNKCAPLTRNPYREEKK